MIHTASGCTSSRARALFVNRVAKNSSTTLRSSSTPISDTLRVSSRPETTFTLMPRLQGKIALITGAAGGLGAALSRAFVAEGAHVVVTDVAHDRARDITTELGTAASFA